MASSSSLSPSSSSSKLLVEAQDAPRVESSTTATYFAKLIDRLKQQRLEVLIKVDYEKSRKKDLEQLIEKKRSEYRELQSKTHNGELAVEVYRSNDKQIQIIERKLQAVKIKLSVAKTDNNMIKHVIDGLRRQKLLQSEINTQFERELKQLVTQVKRAQEEILEGKLRKKEIEEAITKTKVEFSKDRQRFCGELMNAKLSLQQSQKQVIGTIRDRLKKFTEDFLLTQEVAKQTKLMSLRAEESFDISEVPLNDELVDDSKTKHISSSQRQLIVKEDVGASQRSFYLYNSIQRKVDEVEKLRSIDEEAEIELKHQESIFEAETRSYTIRVQAKEFEVERVRGEVEYRDSECIRSVQQMSSVTDRLQRMFDLLILEEQAADQQLITAGLNESNMSNALALIEERIDSIIMIEAAVHRATVNNEDFIRSLRIQRADRIPRPHGLPVIAESDDKGSFGTPVNIPALLLEAGCQSYFQRAYPALPMVEPALPVVSGKL